MSKAIRYGGFSMRQLIALAGQRCIYCKNKVQHKLPHERTRQYHATIEHLVPQSHGGGHRIENIKIACSRCNSMRGTMDYRWFLSFMQDLSERSTFVQHWYDLRPRELKFVRTMCTKRYERWLKDHIVHLPYRRPINT